MSETKRGKLVDAKTKNILHFETDASLVKTEVWPCIAHLSDDTEIIEGINYFTRSETSGYAPGYLVDSDGYKYTIVESPVENPSISNYYEVDNYGQNDSDVQSVISSLTNTDVSIEELKNEVVRAKSAESALSSDLDKLSSTCVKKISASDTRVYANTDGTDTSYTITSVDTTAGTLVFRNGSTGYSVINTPADTSTTSIYIANTGWVNTKLNTKADKATTLAGYGITDAKISNGTITLGSNSITPLTSHLTVDSALSSTSINPVQNKAINSALSDKASTSHTHTTSLASSTGTSSITLAHDGKYSLTAGGTSVVFTMPSDSDSHYTNSLTIQGSGTTATTFSQNADKTLNIVGSGATTVSATADKITITSTDTNTWRGIQDNLYSTSTTESLSAAQGKVLSEAKVNRTETLNVGVDLNTVTTSGFYRLQGSMLNGPGGASVSTVCEYGQLLVVHGGGDTVSQFVMPYSSSIVYMRSGNTVNNTNGTWQSWVTLANMNDLSGFCKATYDSSTGALKLTVS